MAAGVGRWHERARRSIPGGVNSPVRAFRSVGGTPVTFASGAGAWLTDVDGQPLRRPRLLVGPDDPRSRASGGRRGGHRGRRALVVVRRADDRRDRARRGDPRAGRCGRAGALRLVGDRGGHDRGASRACGDGPRRREVRRLLPRPSRRDARAGRLGRRDARAAELPGRHRGRGRGHGRLPYNDREALRELFARDGGAHRRGHHRGGAREHGRRPARRRVRALLRDITTRTVRCSSSTRS
jgi:hypothetical protein